MGNKNYIAGRAFEYRVIKWLIDRGYYVIRSYASHGVFDMVAVPPKGSKLSRALLIQAKRSRTNKIKITTEEKVRLADSAKKYSGWSCIVTNEGKRGRLKWYIVNRYYYDRKFYRQNYNSPSKGESNTIQ